MGAFIGVLVAYSVLCGFIGSAIGRPKGREASGFLFGFFFGVFGLIIIAVMGPTVEAETNRAGSIRAALHGDPNVGDTVRLTSAIKLTRGGRLPQGLESKVLATDAQVQGPTGIHWVGYDSLQVINVGSMMEKKCPRCAENIKAEAVVCRYCGNEFTSEAVPSLTQ
jgi:hypothetical protein